MPVFIPDEYERAMGRGTQTSTNHSRETQTQVAQIDREKFKPPSSTLTVFKICIASILYGAAGYACGFFTAFVIYCINESTEMNSVFSVISYALMVIGALVGGKKAKTKNDKLCTDIILEKNLVIEHHTKCCNNRFFCKHIDSLKQSFVTYTAKVSYAQIKDYITSESLYNIIPNFVKNYYSSPGPDDNMSSLRRNYPPELNQGYIYRCPKDIEEDLTKNLTEYINNNLDIFLEAANKCLKNASLECGLIRAESILKIVEGNGQIDDFLQKINIAKPNRNATGLIENNSVNENLLNAFLLFYDKKIAKDLLDKEYTAFTDLSKDRQPKFAIKDFSADSYIIFLWYFAVFGDKEEFEKASSLVKFFYDERYLETVKLANRVCDYFRNNYGNDTIRQKDEIKKVIEKINKGD